MTGIIREVGSAGGRIYCIDTLNRRTVPRAGLAAAQDDIVELYHKVFRTRMMDYDR